MLKQIDEVDQPQIVRLGDASIASPFTSKLSSVMAGKIDRSIKYSRHVLQVSVRFAEVQVSTSAGCTQAEFRWYRSLRPV